MADVKELIAKLDAFNNWVLKLEKIDEDLFFKPYKEGKWSPAEIISHITYWDKYILEELLPTIRQGAEITSIEFELVNQPAAEYALSGVTMKHLLDCQIKARKELVKALEEKEVEAFFVNFTIDGEEIDSYSGYPNNLYNYMSSFIWHDNHHKDQIEELLAKYDVALS